jgi:hypothetical protein
MIVSVGLVVGLMGGAPAVGVGGTPVAHSVSGDAIAGVVGVPVLAAGVTDVETVVAADDLPEVPVGGLRGLFLGTAVFPDGDDMRFIGGLGAVFGVDEVGTLWAYPLEEGPFLGEPVVAGVGFGSETLQRVSSGSWGDPGSTKSLVGVACDGLMYRHYLGYNEPPDPVERIGNGWSGYRTVLVGWCGRSMV